LNSVLNMSLPRQYHNTMDSHNGDILLGHSPVSHSLRTFKKNLKNYNTSAHTTILALPKVNYSPKNLFDHQEFRGLFIPDHSSVLGKIGDDLTLSLNNSSHQLLESVDHIRKNTEKRQNIQRFYQNSVIPQALSYNSTSMGASPAYTIETKRKISEMRQHQGVALKDKGLKFIKTDNFHTIYNLKNRLKQSHNE
jgi:hypothetical protein